MNPHEFKSLSNRYGHSKSIGIRRNNQRVSYGVMTGLLTRTLVCMLSFTVLSGCQYNHVNSQPTTDALPVHLMPPPQPVGKHLRVYIEGDGRAWRRTGQPSADPTPANRLVQRLMQQDSHPDIAYLAQPCQYHQNRACNQNVWTFERYSPRVVDAMNRAVSTVKASGGYQTLDLVGFSGGGTVALLLAAIRDDVTMVRTVAGNLDPHFTNRLHQVSSMPKALNPSEHHQLASVAQTHFVGRRDTVIPEAVSRHYRERLPPGSCMTTVIVDASHHEGWVERWRQLLLLEPRCQKLPLQSRH